jgi:hypothetical protein
MIPVIVNVFNRLTTTKKLCSQLAEMPDVKITIIDNNSDWSPLLEWYETECEYDIIRLNENMGHHAPWKSGVVARFSHEEYYCVTDCDLDLENIPLDLMHILRYPLCHPSMAKLGIKKSGVSLRIDDLPEWQTHVRNWEGRFWKRSMANGYYRAPIDTTLCMYPYSLPNYIAMSVMGATTVRSPSGYSARHIPWYLDGDDLDEENINYFMTANRSASWRPNGSSLTRVRPEYKS